MSRRVVPEGGVQWNPNAPRAVLVCTDDDSVELSVEPHGDDADRRRLRLVWHDAIASSYLGINDEGLWAHPLYDAGLSELLWLGIVKGSDWNVRGSVYGDIPRQHYIAALKECVVEVLASSYEVSRATDDPGDV